MMPSRGVGFSWLGLEGLGLWGFKVEVQSYVTKGGPKTEPKTTGHYW